MAVEAWLCVGVGVGGALVLLLFLEMLQRNLAKASYRHQWGKRLWRKASIWPQRKKNAALKDILWTQQRFITLGKKKTHQTIEADLNLRGVGPVTLTQQGKMCGGKRYSKGKVLFMPLWFSFECVNMWFATVCRVCMCVGTHVCGCICLQRPGVAVGNHPGSLIESRSPHQTRNLRVCLVPPASLLWSAGWKHRRAKTGISVGPGDWSPGEHLNHGALYRRSLSNCSGFWQGNKTLQFSV